MCDALLDWLMYQGFIPESQFGFLPGRSVDMALACAQTDHSGLEMSLNLLKSNARNL